MNLEERVKALEEQVAKLINQLSGEIKVEPIPNTRYWECVEGLKRYFTEGKIYKLIDGKSIQDKEAFIDECGDNNGFYPHNLEYFKPSTEEAYLVQQQLKNECVHITNNQEYLFVISKFNPEKLSENLFEKEKDICIFTFSANLGIDGYWDYTSHVDEKTTKILSFSEWCKKYGHEEPKWNQGFLVGDYTEKPLILEVSRNKDFNQKFIKEITEVSIMGFQDTVGIGWWQFARKIDFNKYQI